MAVCVCSFPDAEKFVRLWIHESNRTYGDRLVGAADLAKYKQLTADTVKKFFGN